MSRYHRVFLSESRYCVHIDSPLYNGRLAPERSANFGFSKFGCPYRGTTTCFVCLWEPVMECDYKCALCPERYRCKCGHDQTVRLQAAGVV